jgi:asparagine synthase (glutamine-hydrolysing)
VSGIVGIVNLDGAPIDRDLLAGMVEYMEFRGPDGRAMWVDGPVGLGHALLATTDESPDERQPCSLDGRVWITADARVDARSELIEQLESRGRAIRSDAPDVELILHAYHVWGEECVRYLIGDFAFAIWDGHKRRLFCARDHFGVKPFFYAQVGRSLVFSNTLNCVRMHPAVSDKLNDLAIADFLLFDSNQEPSTTTFADIRPLPAAHTLRCDGDSTRTIRYWTLPITDPIRFKDPTEYVERFRALLRTAVADRLRCSRVGVSMSGGLDSTTVAATALEVLAERGSPFELRAYTVVYDRLIPDQERHYAGLVAKSLGFPIHFQALDDYGLYERWDQPELRRTEPVVNPLLAVGKGLSKALAAGSKVALGGDGGDPILYPATVLSLVGTTSPGRLLADLASSLIRWRQVPRIGIRSRMNRWLHRTRRNNPYPRWLNPEFAARLDLPGRWAEAFRPKPSAHPTRATAYRGTADPTWAQSFEESDPGETGAPVELRYPLFDLRVVSFALALPPFPWCIDKLVLRLATRGVLPEAVRLRPKAPLAGDPILAHLRERGGNRLESWAPVPELSNYVDVRAVPEPCAEDDSLVVWASLRPRSLNYWLRFSRPFEAGSG